MTQSTTIIYLTGKPGVGKYTIAKALAKNYGFIVCDNQLINNPIFELLQYDSSAKIPDFAWESISYIRKGIFYFLTKMPHNSYVLTNWLAENEKDRVLYEQVKSIAEMRGSLFVPVELQITKEEHLKRLTRKERRKRWKSIDPLHTQSNEPLLPIFHPNTLKLDISSLSPEDAAHQIIDHIKSLRS